MRSSGRVLVPTGGFVVALLEAYFDESDSLGDPNAPPVLVVAGYMYDKDRALAMERPWRAWREKYGLTHFHMQTCNENTEEFARYSDEECIAIQTEFMDLLKEHVLAGFVVSIDLAYAHLLPSSKEIGVQGPITPYTFCCYWCLRHVRTWALRHD